MLWAAEMLLSQQCDIFWSWEDYKQIRSVVCSWATEGLGELKLSNCSHFHCLNQEQSHDYTVMQQKVCRTLKRSGMFPFVWSGIQSLWFPRDGFESYWLTIFRLPPKYLTELFLHYVIMQKAGSLKSTVLNTNSTVVAATFVMEQNCHFSTKAKLYAVFVFLCNTYKKHYRKAFASW